MSRRKSQESEIQTFRDRSNNEKTDTTSRAGRTRPAKKWLTYAESHVRRELTNPARQAVLIAAAQDSLADAGQSLPIKIHQGELHGGAASAFRDPTDQERQYLLELTDQDIQAILSNTPQTSIIYPYFDSTLSNQLRANLHDNKRDTHRKPVRSHNQLEHLVLRMLSSIIGRAMDKANAQSHPAAHRRYIVDHLSKACHIDAPVMLDLTEFKHSAVTQAIDRIPTPCVQLVINIQALHEAMEKVQVGHIREALIGDLILAKVPKKTIAEIMGGGTSMDTIRNVAGKHQVKFGRIGRIRNIDPDNAKVIDSIITPGFFTQQERLSHRADRLLDAATVIVQHQLTHENGDLVSPREIIVHLWNRHKTIIQASPRSAMISL